MLVIPFSPEFFSEIRRVIRKVDGPRSDGSLNIINSKDSIAMGVNFPPDRSEPNMGESTVLVQLTGTMGVTGQYAGQIILGELSPTTGSGSSQSPDNQPPPGKMLQGQTATVWNLNEIGPTSLGNVRVNPNLQATGGSHAIIPDNNTPYIGKVIDYTNKGQPIVFIGGSDWALLRITGYYSMAGNVGYYTARTQKFSASEDAQLKRGDYFTDESGTDNFVINVRESGVPLPALKADGTEYVWGRVVTDVSLAGGGIYVIDFKSDATTSQVAAACS